MNDDERMKTGELITVYMHHCRIKSATFGVYLASFSQKCKLCNRLFTPVKEKTNKIVTAGRTNENQSSPALVDICNASLRTLLVPPAALQLQPYKAVMEDLGLSWLPDQLTDLR